MKNVLIVTTTHDVGADFIIKDLRSRPSVQVFRFNTEEYPSKIKITVSHNSRGEINTTFCFPEQGVLKSSEIFSAYYRREAEPELDKLIKRKDDRLFARTEIVGALDTVWDTLDCLWVNHPRYSTSLMTKVAQTHYGGLVGLRVPKTIITSNYNEIIDFYKMCNQNVVIKQLGNARGSQDWIEGRLYTQKIEPEHLKLFKNAKYAPIMMQEAIAKKFELRITVVGDKILPVKIDSQYNTRTMNDWRRGPIGKIPHEKFKIPPIIANKLLRLHKKLNLIYSGTDMIVTPNNKYVLLELNPNGEYVWIEVLTGLPITKAISELLLSERKRHARGRNPAIR